MKFKIACLIYIFSFSVQARYPDAPSFTSTKISTEELLKADTNAVGSEIAHAITTEDVSFKKASHLPLGNSENSVHSGGTSENSDGGTGVNSPWAGR